MAHLPINSDAANDLAGTEAPRAHIHGLRSAIDDDMYPLYVGRPAALGPTLRVAYQITGHDTLVADFTVLAHFLHLPVGDCLTSRGRAAGKPLMTA